ncbi:hypothetical protein, partial [Atlantibacter subterraneus]|uniref:hypothetical protein n=1 Tax=Atlantibacter subterraneus TaxID=255519 RepID=UPI0028A2C675
TSIINGSEVSRLSVAIQNVLNWQIVLNLKKTSRIFSICSVKECWPQKMGAKVFVPKFGLLQWFTQPM